MRLCARLRGIIPSGHCSGVSCSARPVLRVHVQAGQRQACRQQKRSDRKPFTANKKVSCAHVPTPRWPRRLPIAAPERLHTGGSQLSGCAGGERTSQRVQACREGWPDAQLGLGCVDFKAALSWALVTGTSGLLLWVVHASSLPATELPAHCPLALTTRWACMAAQSPRWTASEECC